MGDLPEEVDEVVLEQAGPEEEQRAPGENLCECAPEVRLGVDGLLVLLVPHHYLGGQPVTSPLVEDEDLHELVGPGRLSPQKALQGPENRPRRRVQGTDDLVAVLDASP